MKDRIYIFRIVIVFLSLLEGASCISAQRLCNKITIRNNKSILSQMKYEDMTYRICTNINLNGDTLFIPQGSTLQFVRGLINNGVIIGQSTKIKAAKKQIFGDNLLIKGSWDVDIVYSEWFGPRGNGTDDTAPLVSFLNFPASKKTLHKGLYNVRELHCVGLRNTELYAYGAKLVYLRTDVDTKENNNYAVLTNYIDSDNEPKTMSGHLHIYGLSIDGNSQNFIYNSVPDERTDIVTHHTLSLLYLDSLLLQDCYFTNSFMTAVDLEACNNVLISKCSIINSGESEKYKPFSNWYTWEGISLVDNVSTLSGWERYNCNSCIITDSYFDNIGGSFASANCRFFRCVNNTIKNNRGYAFELSSSYPNRIVEIKDNVFYNVGSSILNLTFFTIPDCCNNSIIVEGNEFHCLGYDSQRTIPPPNSFLMLYRNKEGLGTGKLEVTINNNLFEFNYGMAPGLICCDSFTFSKNLCKGFMGEKGEALFFCANDNYQGSYNITDNVFDLYSGALAIIRSPKFLTVKGNVVNTSKSPAIVYIQGEKADVSEYRIEQNTVNGVPSMVYISTEPRILYLKENSSNSIIEGIIRESSAIKVKSVFSNNSFTLLSNTSKNITIIKTAEGEQQ